MNEIKIFEHPTFGNVRTITEDGKTLFCGSDVAKALGYKRPSDAISSHCKCTVKRSIPHPQSQEKTIEMLFVNEGDIYRLAARSDLPGADEFESWIFDEVLPSIRKNGGYIAGQEEMSDADLIAKALTVATRILEEREKRLSVLEPKGEYFDCLVDRNLLTNFRDTAKEFHMRQSELINELLDTGYIYRATSGYKKGKLLPYQQHIDDGLFELKEFRSPRNQYADNQTLITPKGRETFRLMFNIHK